MKWYHDSVSTDSGRCRKEVRWRLAVARALTIKLIKGANIFKLRLIRTFFSLWNSVAFRFLTATLPSPVSQPFVSLFVAWLWPLFSPSVSWTSKYSSSSWRIQCITILDSLSSSVLLIRPYHISCFLSSIYSILYYSIYNTYSIQL